MGKKPKSERHMDHAAFNEFDIVTVNDKVFLFYKDNLLTDYDDSKRDSGIVFIKVQHAVKTEIVKN